MWERRGGGEREQNTVYTSLSFPLLLHQESPGMACATSPHEGRSSSCYLLSGPTLRDITLRCALVSSRGQRDAELTYTPDVLQMCRAIYVHVPHWCGSWEHLEAGHVPRSHVPFHMSPDTTGPSPLHPSQFRSLHLPHETCTSFSHRPCWIQPVVPKAVFGLLSPTHARWPQVGVATAADIESWEQ